MCMDTLQRGRRKPPRKGNQMNKLEFTARLLMVLMGVASLAIVFVMKESMDSTLMEGLFTVDRLKDSVCAIMGLIFFVNSGFFFLIAIPKNN